ncbi:hypothetical protein J3D55_001080 [Chryseobacterium ginsenosidimutans]|jgi:hypothetical protein|uniref:bacteriocin-like protein n=1 Tax=Chryseobacterium ginsenosidimutans TaxID=687846 RepID=UPI004041CCD4|nr:hypothetical protein [Chryseobacterium ginsenosidimutans]
MKNIKKLSRENLRQITGAGQSQPIQSPDGGYYCLRTQGQLCLVSGCTPMCVNGACHISMCLDINP